MAVVAPTPATATPAAEAPASTAAAGAIVLRLHLQLDVLAIVTDEVEHRLATGSSSRRSTRPSQRVRDRQSLARRVCRIVGVAGELRLQLAVLNPPRPRLLEQLRRDLLLLLLWLLLLAAGRRR
jgi:hypothetical protein